MTDRTADQAGQVGVPEVPYGPPVARVVPPRWKVDKKDAATLAVRIAAPFVLGALVKALAKR